MAERYVTRSRSRGSARKTVRRHPPIAQSPIAQLAALAESGHAVTEAIQPSISERDHKLSGGANYTSDHATRLRNRPGSHGEWSHPNRNDYHGRMAHNYSLASSSKALQSPAEAKVTPMTLSSASLAEVLREAEESHGAFNVVVLASKLSQLIPEDITVLRWATTQVFESLRVRHRHLRGVNVETIPDYDIDGDGNDKFEVWVQVDKSLAGAGQRKELEAQFARELGYLLPFDATRVLVSTQEFGGLRE